MSAVQPRLFFGARNVARMRISQPVASNTPPVNASQQLLVSGVIHSGIMQMPHSADLNISVRRFGEYLWM
jgi:hypothetical protein